MQPPEQQIIQPEIHRDEGITKVGVALAVAAGATLAVLGLRHYPDQGRFVAGIIAPDSSCEQTVSVTAGPVERGTAFGKEALVGIAQVIYPEYCAPASKTPGYGDQGTQPTPSSTHTTTSTPSPRPSVSTHQPKPANTSARRPAPTVSSTAS